MPIVGWDRTVDSKFINSITEEDMIVLQSITGCVMSLERFKNSVLYSTSLVDDLCIPYEDLPLLMYKRQQGIGNTDMFRWRLIIRK